MDILSIMPWIWLGVFALLVVIEALTQGLTTIWGAIGALMMIFISRAHLALGWQLMIFLAITLALLVLTRPFVVRRLKVGSSRTNVNSMIGQEVIVTKAITKFQRGEARAQNGVVWTAASASARDEAIAEGTVCVIRSVDGNTLMLEADGRNKGE